MEKNKEFINSRDRVVVRYYTDPLCCWSWAFESQWKKFVEKYKDHIDCHYSMGGMIPDWNTFNDPLNTVSRPAHLGPVWMECKYITGVNNDGHIWIQDPPSSSFPACIAVKAASLQSREAEGILLYHLRKSALTERKNIAKKDIILEVAHTVEDSVPQVFNFEKFKNDLSSKEARELFQADLKRSRYLGITRFPAITFNKNGREGLLIIGYRPFELLEKIFIQINPEMKNFKELEEENNL